MGQHELSLEREKKEDSNTLDRLYLHHEGKWDREETQQTRYKKKGNERIEETIGNVLVRSQRFLKTERRKVKTLLLLN